MQSKSLKMQDVSFSYAGKRSELLKHVSLEITPGERVGLIGPSGCGKSTLAKLLCGFEKPRKGSILIDGAPLPKRGYNPVQLIYQHPEKAINPRWKLGETIQEGWSPSPEVLERMGIEKEWLDRWPNELSGGELQRFCIARALSPKTRYLIADEMSTMLDVITQAQMWEFLLDIAEEHMMGILVVTHDRALADRVCTRIVEFEDINS